MHTSSRPAGSLTGVILSAGKGSRIDPFNTRYPKPMLPIVNRPILEHQVEQMKSVGIREIVIVVGHLQEVIREHFGDGQRFGVEIRYVEQKNALGIAHAAMQLERHLSGAFLLFLGDIFYVAKDLEAMVRTFDSGGVNGVLAVKRELDPAAIQKNFSVTIDDHSNVSKVVEKPRYLINNLKGCGMYLFGPEIFDALRQTPRTAMRDEYELTTAIQIFIDEKYRVKACEVVDWDCNITFPADLLECNARFLRHTGAPNAVAKSARVHSGATLSGAVLGDDVFVEHPIRVVNSILLPGTHITDRVDVVDSVVSKDLRIHCPQR
ncbi:MAG TPA: sugar phosphate nucleotidyltransferase [Planctomycetota bacterium]|nr:sugar phosphate nucleotidyltransferase [Planctomycetota bacterium]